MIRQIPNILSIFRILSAPVLLILAWHGLHKYYLGLLIAAFVSDALDGFIARNFNATSKLGTLLDSYGDMAVFLSLPLGVWWLWPELIRQELVFVVASIIAFVLPLIWGILKFKSTPSYHTIGAKIGAVLMCPALLCLLIFEWTIFFRVAVIFQAMTAIEEILITLYLSTPQTNVKSLWHVMKQGDRKMVNGDRTPETGNRKK